MLIIVQLEVVFIAVPVVVLLRDISTNMRYFGYMLILWVLPMSSLLFIMVPKVIAYRKAVLGINNGRQRGNHGVRVSGLSLPINTVSTIHEQSKVSEADSYIEQKSVVECHEESEPEQIYHCRVTL